MDMRELKPYLRQVARALYCPRGQRAQFLGDLERMAADFLSGKSDATAQEVREFLGDPRELAQSYLDTLEPETVEGYRKKRRVIQYCLIGLGVAVVLFACYMIAYTERHWHDVITVEETTTIYVEVEKE